MSKENIYDIHISELLLRLNANSSNNATARLQITSSLNGNTVPENFNGTGTFTSTVINMPTGFSVKSSTHVISTPTAPPTTTSSSSPLTTASHAIILGAVGSTYIVTSTVTLENGVDPDIILNASFTITAVLPIFYGIKAAPVGAPDSTGLSEISSDLVEFELNTNFFGRLYVAIPTALSGADFKGVHGPNSLFIPVSDFVSTTVGSYEYYYTDYDTQLTGPHTKTFLIVYEATGGLTPALPTF